MTIPPDLNNPASLTDAVLEELRTEPKKKTSFTRQKQKGGHLEQHFELVSAEGARQYMIFTRRTASNAAVFSVGLTLVLPDKSIVLCRYNSGYHPHRNILEKTRVPATAHKHIATERYIAAGLDPDGFAEPAIGYGTMEEALAKLVQDCSVQGILKPPPPTAPPAADTPETPQPDLF